jgi:alpha,alpha-trehalase
MQAPTAYRPISDYALIGNTHSAALVGTDGSIDWCCLPHFDSGAVFCRLLDAGKGGFLRIAPVGGYRTSRRYSDGTAVVETDFDTVDGRVRLIDFMHTQRIAHSRLGVEDPHCHRLLRCVEGLSGRVEVEVVFRPTFDFARRPARLELTPTGVFAQADHEHLLLRAGSGVSFQLRGDAAVARVRLMPGERVWIVLAYGDAHTGDAALQGADPELLLAQTCRHWREWEGMCTYEGPFLPQVRLSARVLKMLTFGPTGALVAAPTSSLPERVGGERNWDYRFCWLRDAALVLHALMSIGLHEAAADFFHWLDGLCEGECDHLQIMYRLDGGARLPEQELHHLSGYRGSAPVRIGNAAAGQKQLDVYGHVLDSALVWLNGTNAPIRRGLRLVLRHLADQAAARWREPDHGLWEVRGKARHFLSSKLMCWTALDRAVRLATAGKLDGDARRWRAERDAVRDAIFDHGWDSKIGAFTQVLGAPDLDASALMMPLVGFLPASDERMRSTVAAIRERLTAHGLVYRYLNDDGVAGGEATFAFCSYWLVDNLALQGRLDEACELFAHVNSFASDLGLLSEQIDPASRELLGNYPQGFTHLGLIHSALTIERTRQRLGVYGGPHGRGTAAAHPRHAPAGSG